MFFFMSMPLPGPLPLDKWERKVTQPAGSPLVPDNWTYQVACENSCFSSLLAAKDTSPGGTSVPQ